MAQKDGVKKRIADRRAVVGAAKGAPGGAVASRRKFYVQTRMGELKAKGKTGDPKALRAKFDSGGVTRAGFYNKVDKVRNKVVSTPADTGSKFDVAPNGRVDSSGRSGFGAGVTSRTGRTDASGRSGFGGSPARVPKSNVTRDAGKAGNPKFKSKPKTNVTRDAGPAGKPKSNVTRDAGPAGKPKSNVTRDAGPAGKPYPRSNRGGKK